MADAMNLANAATAETAAGPLPAEAAVQAHMLLRALPEILMRASAGKPTHDRGAAAVRTDLRLAAMLRARIDRAELQDWLRLAKEAWEERGEEKHESGPDDNRIAPDTDGCDSPAAMSAMAQLVAGQVQSGCVKSALHILTFHGKAADTEATWDNILKLVAEEAPAWENGADATAVAEALTQRAPRAPCRVRTTKRRVRVLRAGAEPGPSGWRNSHLATVLRRPNGASTIAR